MDTNKYNKLCARQMDRGCLMRSLFILISSFLLCTSTPVRAVEEEGICARVRIRISQDVVIARNAFRATLEISNSAENVPLENLAIILDVKDSNDQPANDLFGIHPPELSGVDDVNGGGVVEPGITASATWMIVPTRDAAPDQPTQYFIGGQFTYTEDGLVITVPLFPAPIMVKPDPLLVLDYFLVRDVYSDDPFTSEIEPAEPFPLGLMIRNNGKGEANNLRITTSQPEIIENEKGLLIDFKIIGTQVNTDPITPSLTINLGNIEPGTTSVAMWIMKCSLQGKFIEYSASFEHIDGLGNQRLSLIDTVAMHELLHAVRVDVPTDDHKPDFLVNDVTDENHLPDTLYNSNGVTEIVTVGLNPIIDGEINNSNDRVTLTSSVSNGWVYIRTNDPGQDQFQLSRVVRSDGREIIADENAWTTHRTIRLKGQPPYREHLLHLFDKDSTGSYTLFYETLDKDNDGIPDSVDNCWNVANPDQLDSNHDCPPPPYGADPLCGDACEASQCGNNLREGTEVCDGSDLGGETCESQRYSGGVLACLADCSGFDTSGCTSADADGDGYPTPADCDDDDKKIYPGAPELCNAKDDDCDNAIDEDLTQSCGTGVCAGTQTCSSGSWTNCSTYNNVCADCALCSEEGECNIFSSGTLCRPLAGPCDVAEYCTGSSPTCPPDAYKTYGSPCDDDQYCTLTDTCQNGICVGSGSPCAPPLVCSEERDMCVSATIINLGQECGTACGCIPIVLTNAAGFEVYTINCDIGYISDTIVAKGCLLGPAGLAAGKEMSTCDYSTPGKVTIEVNSAGDVIGDGIVAFGDFDVLAALGTDTSLTLTCTAKNPQGQDVPVTSEGGSKKIIRVGDFNCDIWVTIDEVIKVVRMYLGEDPVSPIADPGCDGEVQIFDVIKAINCYLETPDCPC